MSLDASYVHANVEPESERTSSLELGVPRFRRESVILAFFSGVLSAILAVLLVFKYNLVYGDALTRVLNAYYVIRGNFHLAGIGFVWNPFPSLMELPFVLLHSLWRPILADGLPGALISCLFSGVTVYYAHRIFVIFGAQRKLRIVWSLLLMVNPLLLLYGANGMSDIMMVGAFLGATEGVIRYVETNRLAALISSAVWLAMALGIRYEAVPFGFFLAVALALVLRRQRKGISEIVASSSIVLFPVVCAGIIWIILNGMIMHDPFYFINSEYGNAAQTSAGNYTTKLTLFAYHDLPHAIEAVGRFDYLYLPALLILPFLLLIPMFKHQHGVGWIISMCMIAVPLFQVDLLFKGNSAAWARFFIEYIPFGALGCAYLIRFGRRWIWGMVATGLMVIGDISTTFALNNPTYGHGDYEIVRLVEQNKPDPAHASYVGQAILVSERKQASDVAKFINSHPKMIVLLDNFTDYLVVPLIKNPNQIIVTNDRDFQSLLLNPRGRVSAFLVPRNQGVSHLNAINVQYPNLWARGASWARLLKTFPGPYEYRMYAIR